MTSESLPPTTAKRASTRNTYGLGSVYQRPGSDIWYIRFYDRGRTYRESSGKTDRREALKILKKRHAEAAAGSLVTIEVKRTTVGELLDDLLADYVAYHPRSLKNFAQPVIKHLRDAFGPMQAVKLGTSALKEYIRKRRTEGGVAAATVNRELALLRRAFNLGKDHTPPKITGGPNFKALTFRENNARQGFFEHADYLKMREALPRDEGDILTYAYYTGCRRSEILKLQWQYVDLQRKAIRLPAEDAGSGMHMKSNEARIIPLCPELLEMLTARHLDTQDKCPRSPWVFCHLEINNSEMPEHHVKAFIRKDGTSVRAHTIPAHRRIRTENIGEPICNIYDVWNKTAKKVGLDGKLLHDLRRTGVRNLVRAGVPESVAMRISGHKTRSVFARYNIVTENDLHDAASKLSAYTRGVA